MRYLGMGIVCIRVSRELKERMNRLREVVNWVKRLEIY
jgi:hypothetical protein